jgi:16S rRNA (guanine966-N2)-methyltransferase
MRIIAGRLGGRLFESPHGHRTHPMSDKIRGALFNSLGDITGHTFLDAFAGTGAVGFEAISRGAKHVTSIELDQSAFTAIMGNITALDIGDQVSAMRKDVKSWSRNHKETQFDVVICDPPYDDVKYTLLIQLAKHTRPGGLLIYSLPTKHEFRLPEEFKLLDEKSYGDAVLLFFKRN